MVRINFLIIMKINIYTEIRGVKKKDNIRKVVRGKSKTAGGFIWK